MLRILRSTLTVAASASNATVNSDITQADLEAAVPVGGSITPLAFVLDPEDADVTISSLVIGNTKNDEGKVNMVPSGAALSLSALNKVLSMESGGVDAPRLSVAHGARLTAVVSNAVASPKTISILWKVENQAPTETFEGAIGGAPRLRVPLTEGLFDLFQRASRVGGIEPFVPGESRLGPV